MALGSGKVGSSSFAERRRESEPLDRGEVFFQLPGTRFELVTNGFSDHYSTD